MISQEEIDAVLGQAQQAVDALNQDVNTLVGETDRAIQQGSGPMFGAAAPTAAAPGGAAAKAGANDRAGRILNLRVPVVVRLAERKLPVSEVMKMSPGTILEFERTADSELDLLINRQQIGAGIAVKVNEHFGLRVTFIGDVKQRIASFGH